MSNATTDTIPTPAKKSILTRIGDGYMAFRHTHPHITIWGEAASAMAMALVAINYQTPVAVEALLLGISARLMCERDLPNKTIVPSAGAIALAGAVMLPIFLLPPSPLYLGDAPAADAQAAATRKALANVQTQLGQGETDAHAEVTATYRPATFLTLRGPEMKVTVSMRATRSDVVPENGQYEPGLYYSVEQCVQIGDAKKECTTESHVPEHSPQRAYLPTYLRGNVQFDPRPK